MRIHCMENVNTSVTILLPSAQWGWCGVVAMTPPKFASAMVEILDTHSDQKQD